METAQGPNLEKLESLAPQSRGTQLPAGSATKTPGQGRTRPFYTPTSLPLQARSPGKEQYKDVDPDVLVSLRLSRALSVPIPTGFMARTATITSGKIVHGRIVSGGEEEMAPSLPNGAGIPHSVGEGYPLPGVAILPLALSLGTCADRLSLPHPAANITISRQNGRQRPDPLSQVEFFNVIGGGPRGAKESHRVEDPRTEAALWDAPVASAQDLDEAVAAGQRAFTTWGRSTLAERAEVLNAVAKVLYDNDELLTAILMRETGKSRIMAHMEVQRAAFHYEYVPGLFSAPCDAAYDLQIRGDTPLSKLLRENGYEVITVGDGDDDKAAAGKKKGLWMAPTIIVNPPEDSLVVREEQFGPVVPIMKWEDEADVIARANLDNAGLGASIWCRDADRARKLARQLETGTVFINQPPQPHHAGYFAGQKLSGVGGELGKQGLLSYCQTKSLHIGKK
ncbi:aldehyde dehydrogenase [Apiospora marii]|uniref:aldehyde dehydrogenase (NAD(+)) n=1 Tax=Apiospora marii TaxID=335849 RepID=A0ABR1R9W3_9PEZI